MLYYTGAVKPEDSQQDPSLSLGEYKSSSQIPNGTIHNLFPKITQSTVIKDKKIIRMIVLQNLSPNSMTNLKLFIENGQYSLFTMSAIAPGFDAQCNRYFFEKVPNEESLPYQGTLMTYTETDPLIIPELLTGKYIGIWIRRALDQTKFSDFDRGKDGLGCDETIEALQAQVESDIPVEDQMKFHIEWD